MPAYDWSFLRISTLVVTIGITAAKSLLPMPGGMFRRAWWTLPFMSVGGDLGCFVSGILFPGKRTHYAKYQKMLSLVTSKKWFRLLTLISYYMDTPILHSEVINYSSQIGIPPVSRLSPVLMNLVFRLWMTPICFRSTACKVLWANLTSWIKFPLCFWCFQIRGFSKFEVFNFHINLTNWAA